jgi:Nucleotide modification associated domain 3
MKIILSRKGFDSSAGGKASPIFPDGTMLSLPIPDKASPIAYQDIAGNQHASVGELVEDLAKRPPAHRAHLDPDLSAHALPRMHGWRPLFGQEVAAEKHLENHNVGAGDIFVFFGRFRRVERPASQWQYVRSCRPVHVIFGWLQVAERVPVCEWPDTEEWAHYHPHFHRKPHPANVVYVAAKRLVLPGVKSPAVPGAETVSCVQAGIAAYGAIVQQDEPVAAARMVPSQGTWLRAHVPRRSIRSAPGERRPDAYRGIPTSYKRGVSP